MSEGGLGVGSVRYAELHIRITPELGRVYRVNMGYTPAGSTASSEWTGRATFDQDELGQTQGNIAEYGRRVWQALFADDALREGFKVATNIANPDQLRVRLDISPDLPELHAMRWETLRTPDDAVLATGDRILFSRYLASPDWRRVPAVRERDLRALVMIANPSNLVDFSPEGTDLQPLNVGDELERAKRALGSIPLKLYVTPGTATVENLMGAVRGGCNIVYLICHGAYIGKEARLYLESPVGSVVTVTGEQLAREFGQLLQVPLLVVLASCQSAGSASGGALTSVGPLLARVGVPSVLAMQERVSVETSDLFIETFFTELNRDGRLDRAAAAARSRTKNMSDFWVPVLFSRMSDGCLWQPPLPEQDFPLYPSIVSQIQKGSCTPIIGPGLIEFLLGPTREMAQRWADTFHFPMSARDRQDLPQVAQFLAVNMSDPSFPADELARYLQREIELRYGSLPELQSNENVDEVLDALTSDVGRRQRANNGEQDSYRILASLPFPIYVTANPDNLLYDALKEAGRDPVVELSYWLPESDATESVFVREPEYTPSVARPLVYHIFGQLRQRDSLVLTEDSFFDFMLGANNASWKIPGQVTAAWNKNALLFIGFQLDNWTFRVLFRVIISQPGAKLRRRKPNAAVQVNPDERTSQDPLRAREYLEQYLQGEQIKTYWGTSESFLDQLWQEWIRTTGARPASAVTPAAVGAGRR